MTGLGEIEAYIEYLKTKLKMMVIIMEWKQEASHLNLNGEISRSCVLLWDVAKPSVSAS